MLLTLNDVHDSWAKEMAGEGFAGVNVNHPIHHVVSFVSRPGFIKSLNHQMIVIVVRTALEASPGKFDVLVRWHNLYQCFAFMTKLRLYFVGHVASGF